MRDFERRVEHYVRLHRRLERALPSEHLFADDEDMSAVTDALHAALIDARPHAQAGSIFTPEIGEVLKARLAVAFAVMGHAPAKIAMSLNLGYMAGVPEPQVNGRFPAIRHTRLWPALLAALPELPEELQYRFVDRDLVLVDVHADLVVDILKEALPEPHAGLVRDSAPLRKSPQGDDDGGS